MREYKDRPIYLQMILEYRHNSNVKIITGPRRCGKSWLLSRIYKNYLIEDGIPEENIIMVSFDLEDEDNKSELADKDLLKAYLYERITDPNQQYYVFLDEIQEVDGFEKVVNGLNNKRNVDVYVTGSNAHMLSSDINTIFRGRGDEIRCNPYTFKEFCAGRDEPLNELWKEYYTYGGLPALIEYRTPIAKTKYLKRLWTTTYLKDIIEKNSVTNIPAMSAIVDALSSSIGSLTNPTNIKNTLQSVQHIKIDEETVGNYLGYLEDAYLFSGARRYDIKGKEYFKSFAKYYCCDIGLRNVRLNFRQQEISHIMENIIYNELSSRGYLVDVGMVESREMRNGKSQYIQYEVDFIATNGIDKYYIQSAYAIESEEKRQQELRSFKKIDDSFQKIVIIGNDIATYTNDDGIIFMGLFQFLMNDDILK